MGFRLTVLRSGQTRRNVSVNAELKISPCPPHNLFSVKVQIWSQITGLESVYEEELLTAWSCGALLASPLAVGLVLTQSQEQVHCQVVFIVMLRSSAVGNIF